MRFFLTVFQAELPSIQILSALSDSKSSNTLLLEVKISSKNGHVFLCDLGNLTLPLIFDAWWAWMNVGSKGSIASNNSRHTPCWRFHSHCGIEETSSLGIICIVCHQVLRHPSEHGTSSMGRLLQAEADIARLYELTFRCYRTDWFNHWLNRFGNTQEWMNSRKYHS